LTNQPEVIFHKSVRSWKTGRSSDVYLLCQDFTYFLFVDGVQTLSEKFAFAKNHTDAFEILTSYGVFCLIPQTTTYLSVQTMTSREFLANFTLSLKDSTEDNSPAIFKTTADQIVLDRADGFGTRDDLIVHADGRTFVSAITTGLDLLLFEVREFGEIHFTGVAEISGWSLVEGFETLVGHCTTLFQGEGLGNNPGSTLDLYARDSIAIQGGWVTRFRKINEESYANPKKYVEWLRGSVNDWTSNGLLDLAISGQDSKLMKAFAEYLGSLKTRPITEPWWHWREGSNYLMTHPHQTPVPFKKISIPEKGINEFMATVSFFDYQDPKEIAEYLLENS